jgi:prepilin-type N-terminal cleavage/methylation domain-containing protein
MQLTTRLSYRTEQTMIARIRKSMTEKDKGFTLIELLVVMIIIGILAAIAIPVFLNQRKKAQDSATKADVSTVGKEIATWYVDNTVSPTFAQAATEYTIGGSKIANRSANVSVTVAAASSTNWTVTGTNPEGSHSFTYSAANGLQQVG